MVATNAGITLLPALAVQVPAPNSPGIALVPFAEPVPHRRIAMVWRKSSALKAFLFQLAPLIKALPAGLLKAPK